MEKIEVPVWRKYSLSIQEAASYYGIGEKRLRSLVSDNPDEEFVIEIGAHVRIKRRKFEEYLDNSGVI